MRFFVGNVFSLYHLPALIITCPYWWGLSLYSSPGGLTRWIAKHHWQRPTSCWWARWGCPTTVGLDSCMPKMHKETQEKPTKWNINQRTPTLFLARGKASKSQMQFGVVRVCPILSRKSGFNKERGGRMVCRPCRYKYLQSIVQGFQSQGPMT